MGATATTTRTFDDFEIPAAGTWVIDSSHASIEFVARHLMVSKVRGSFKEFSGTIEIAADPARSSTAVTGSGANWSVTGDLTIHGVTSPITLEVEFLGVVTDPWGNGKAACSASGDIGARRTD